MTDGSRVVAVVRTAVLAGIVAISVPLAADETRTDGLDIRTGLEPGVDNTHRAGVDPGRLEGPFEWRSDVYPDTVRLWWVFVPAQYDPDLPANLLVFQDGHRAVHPEGSLQIPVVLANLAHDGVIPPTIGVFVTPGHRGEPWPADLEWGNPNHRAQEYDALDDRYVTMLADELLPQVEARFNVSADPTRRAIGGTSSGAMAAFTAAWLRPDQFGNVISFIGSYVSIGFRQPSEESGGHWVPGGQDWPALLRRESIRPLAIYLQDGVNDLDNEWGHWFLANRQMAAALRYANRAADEQGDDGPRYRLETVWTDGEHADRHAGILMPEALRWIWGEVATASVNSPR
ncbi:esterase family protein [Marinihelvus fidelis]|uniref:Esterase family protein n=1 Tax=Marinihelvus fidelis TaxID=2613842 RepID=A0A5N0TEX3_9GAMM|nr:alpha/beta hydrolase-fold protein [Marinihelvus fidelis]KAA9132657.1 esterase family protein [Marinihelvus fidelis]